MECPICLDPLLPQSILGRIHNCHHVYHDNCIIEWSGRSNNCPTCREMFNQIDIVASNLPDIVIQTLPVQNRLIENDAINNIPSEYVITPLDFQEQITLAVEPDRADATASGVCLICSSAQYTSASRKIATCVGCGAKFHHACLGRTVEPTWFCPVCDCHQEFPLMRRDTWRQGPSRRSNPQAHSRPLNTDSAMENDLFEDSAPLVRSSNVLNGGVILRREERARRNLTPAEAKSWDLFEQARKGDDAVPDTVSTNDEKKRKRRPKPTHNSTLNTESSNEANRIKFQNQTLRATPSRISSLMSQIRSKSDGAQDSSSSSDPIVIDLVPENDKSLTLEQKRMVQKHVRKFLLRYFDGRDPTLYYLKTEEQYIYVNKNISHGVYAHILAEYNDSQKLQDFFSHHDEKLQFLVKDKVDEWLQTVKA